MLQKDVFVFRSLGIFVFVGFSMTFPGCALHAASVDDHPRINKENHKNSSKQKAKQNISSTVSRSPETITIHSSGVGRTLRAAVNGGALGSRSAFDTPFSVMSVNAATIQARQATDINAVFAQDSSVTIANSGSGAASGASFKIRGLTVDSLNGYKVDGLAIPYWSIDLPVENFESIQLIKGASAFMYGFGAPGGVVNFEIKKPHDASTISLEAGYRSDAVFRQMIDAGGTLIDQGRLRYRFSFVNEIGNLFNGGTMRRDGVTLAFDGKITNSLKWDASMFFMKTLQENMINTLSISSDVTSLPSVSGRTQLGARGSWKTNDMKVVTAGLTWDINPNWHSRLSYRYSVLDEDFPGTLMTMTNNKGDYYDNAFFIQREWWYNQIQEVTEGHINTGPFRHDIVAGVSWERQLYDTDANATTNTVISTGNIFNDIPTLSGHTPADFYHPRLYHYIDYQQIAPFLSDTVTWKNWSLLAGFRYTWYNENDFSPTGARTASHRNTPVTPVFALTYKIDPGLNVYFSYVRAMQSGGQAGNSNVNRNEVFAPMESSNYELGVKLARKRWSLIGALFRLDSGTGYTNAQNYYMQDGLARYQGVEINGSFAITPRLTLSGGITYLSALYQKASASITGNHVEGTAPLQASAQLHYRVPRLEGLSLDAYFRYVDSMYDGAANTLALPSYRIWDIGANYVLPVGKHHMTFRGMIRNLGGQRYWTTYGNMAALPGDPRTVSLSARIDF